MDELLKMKLNQYAIKLEDYRTDEELTVEITLSEYRNLIEEKTLKSYSLNNAEEENKNLKQENKKLEKILFEYRKKYGELEIDEEVEERRINNEERI